MPCVLIIDDNEDVRQQLKWGLAKEPYELVFAKDAGEALERFAASRPEVVTLDLGLPPSVEDNSQGFFCLGKLRECDDLAKVIVVTGFDGRENPRKAIDMGAFDFFRKPIDLGDLKVMIRRAFALRQLESEAREERLRTAYGFSVGQHGIVGESAAIRKVLGVIGKVAPSDVPVLICGESGTGKELVARAIHEASSRQRGEMVSVNCGAIPENLLESEFFGHEKGAFTGASSLVKGKVEFAHDGTLFLDEIGELPVTLQVKLLRFLQEMAFQRVGGRRNIHVNVRIVAATNINIQAALKAGTLREDLYYRIGVVTLDLPPLRERGEDVLVLADHFLHQAMHQSDKRNMRFSPAAVSAMMAYAWPGNVRELDNKVRRAVVMAAGNAITPDDLVLGEAPSRAGAAEAMTLKEAKSSLEREMVVKAIARFRGNIVKAAEHLGISRPTFYDLVRKHNIENETGGRASNHGDN